MLVFLQPQEALCVSWLAAPPPPSLPSMASVWLLLYFLSFSDHSLGRFSLSRSHVTRSGSLGESKKIPRLKVLNLIASAKPVLPIRWHLLKDVDVFGGPFFCSAQWA